MIQQRFSRLEGDNASAIPSIVNVAEFFIARAPEVVKLYNSMKIKEQFIPNHMRRRIRSYKPWHLRPKKRKVANGEKKPLSRRLRRLHRLHLVEADGCKTRLPATHIWHAKRFRMENIWGMRLPVKVNGKGPRAILRLSKQGCLVHDRSYMDCWRTQIASWEELRDKLKSVGFEGNLEHAKIVSGEFFASGFIKADGIVVSPFQLLRLSENQVELWTHPAARPEVESLMHSLGMQLEAKRIRFELLGARAMDLLRKVSGDEMDAIVQVPGKAQRIAGAVVNVRASGRIIDVMFDDADQAHHIWRSFVRNGASSIGVHDRHALLSHFLAPDFPYDFPSSKAGARHSALEAKRMLESDTKRPKHAKLNPETVESPFFPDWTLVGCTSRIPVESEINSVSLRASKGVIRANAHVYMGENLIGFVTTTCGKEDLRAVAHVSTNAATLVEGTVVEFQNPGSVHRFAATAVRCTLSSTDSNLIDYKLIA